MFTRLNACGELLRFDQNVQPTMYRCATVTQAELEQLRRITNIIRNGRVRRIEENILVLDSGTAPTTPTTLHIDCSADGLERRPAKPVFEGSRITLESVRTCQQVFSAAFIGHIEVRYNDETLKNELCTPVPHPYTVTDYLRGQLADIKNASRWAADPELRTWLANARLNWRDRPASPDDVDPELAKQTRADVRTAVEKLQDFLAKLYAQVNTPDL